MPVASVFLCKLLVGRDREFKLHLHLKTDNGRICSLSQRSALSDFSRNLKTKYSNIFNPSDLEDIFDHIR